MMRQFRVMVALFVLALATIGVSSAHAAWPASLGHAVPLSEVLSPQVPEMHYVITPQSYSQGQAVAFSDVEAAREFLTQSTQSSGYMIFWDGASDYSGSSLQLPPGNYPTLFNGSWNDRITSSRSFGGAQANLYDYTNYGGSSFYTTGDCPVGCYALYGWTKRASSAKVY